MADVDMADALPDLGSQLPVDPDAQATVTDFHDYTEFFPSDLIRSLTLIRKLDKTYLDNTQTVHDLTTTYGSLPTLPPNQRVDPQLLRKQISAALDHAIHCRESALAEATRLYDVAERHCTRLGIIKKKLQALPEPPSRDPTPPPVSPALRRKTDAERTPRLTLNGPSLGARPAAATARPGHGGRRIVPGEILPLPGLGSPIEDAVSDFEDESRASSPIGDEGHAVDAPSQSKRGGKLGRVKIPKQPKLKIPKTPRVRLPGQMGTNVHSAVAGISTSNALAKLEPPPPDAKPGSKHAPWHKLTDYEMAWLRKTMKKNAIWTPSDTMIRRELAQKGRGRENYEKEKARCLATGEPFLDEDPDRLPGQTTFEPLGNAEMNLFNRGMKLNEAKKLKKEAMAREQAAREAMEIEEASRRITAAGDMFKNLFNHNPAEVPEGGTSQKKEAPKSSKKRKREGSPDPARVDTKDMSSGTQEVPARPSGPKKLKLAPPAPPSSATEASASLAPNGTLLASAAGAQPATKTTTVLVPLLPAGPSASPTKSAPLSLTRKSTPAPTSPTTKSSAAEASQKPPNPPSTNATAATTRPRRASVAPTPKATSPPPTTRPSSRGTTAQPHSSTPLTSAAPGRRVGSRTASTKAASVEPPTKRETRDVRRRGSNVSLPVAAPEPAPVSGRETRTRGKRPAPGVVTEEDGGKSKVSVGKRKAAPRKKASGRKEGGELKGEKKVETVLQEEGWEDIDPDEPRYCVCGDVSYGTMVACENDDCEKEWFHLQCVGLTDIPPRRAKWYCPDCRKKLGIDEKGHVMSDPPKGRR